MPIREPGVIVNISGEELPPPLPETRFGIGQYVFAKYGPYKAQFINVRNINRVYKDLDIAVQADINYLLTSTGLYTMLFPNLGVRASVGFTIAESSDPTLNWLTTNGLLVSVAPDVRRTTPLGRPLFYLPTWLYGPPKAMGIYLFGNTNPFGFLQSNDFVYKITITLSNSTQIVRYRDNYLNAAPTHISGQVTAITSPQDVQKIRLVATNNLNILWTYVIGSSEGNIIWVLHEHSGNYVLYLYSENVNLLDISQIEIEYYDSASNSNNTQIITMPSNYRVFNTPQSSPAQYSFVYFTPSYYTIQLNMSYSNTTQTYTLGIVDGSTTTNVPVSYSPLDPDYFGFIDFETLEIIKNGDIYNNYNSMINNGQNPVIIFCDQTNTPLTTDYPFYYYAHEGVVTSYLLGVSITGYPIGTNSNPPSSPYTSNITISYSYIAHRVWVQDIAQDMYSDWLTIWHDAILYFDDDVERFTYSPLEVDLITDYAGSISLAFTRFIRESHDKFMFKVCGSPNLLLISIGNRFDYTKDYWNNLFSTFLGFHAHRVQGYSLTSVSPCAIYLKAVNDYGYAPIFGLNSSLSVTRTDHEFTLSQRESLLDLNLNTSVKDRVLSLYYYNNNLTEEPRRDDSPLGEENNARTAIRLSKLLARFVERYIGEPNTRFTRERVTNEVSAFIAAFLNANRTNLVDFRVICDETNNTPADIANNILNIRVEARFGKSIKYVVVFERILMAT